ncbi:MAG: hypothetical protein K2O31_00945 [Clostridia bacterium]|nr:hypothetical protein [Clostridia bacterium]MDE6604762.1 hypothetical protein [Clostridia bacterium]MDE7208429.1 hypothetical protein [Clostridia bacterium]
MKKKVVLSVAVVLLVVMVAVMCVACTPSQKSVIKKFENKDYKLIAGDADSKVVNLTKAESLTSIKTITITWYDNEDDAKDAYEASIKLPGQSEKTVKRKGNAVAIGDEDSIKIF